MKYLALINVRCNGKLYLKEELFPAGLKGVDYAELEEKGFVKVLQEPKPAPAPKPASAPKPKKTTQRKSTKVEKEDENDVS